mmetsp:Transcript_6643/g.8660  ORF Transcript_6643/g.8660 Transcript_6643/m.8660 type:complete len:250 (-) Transcript_6643:222-971(-)
MDDVQTLTVAEDAVEEEVTLEVEAEGDKESSPCSNFRIDTTKTFGLCKCGWAKTDHTEKEENKAAQALRNLRAKSAKYNDDDYMSVDGPCNKYRVDTSAAEFGTCKCGYKQADHKAKVENKASLALKSLKSKNAPRNTRTKGSSPCNNYRVDVSAANFGDCLCGFPKDAHKEETENAGARALRLLKEKNAAKNAKEDAIANGTYVEEDDGAVEEDVAPEVAPAAVSAPAQPVGTATTPAKAGGGCCIVS